MQLEADVPEGQKVDADAMTAAKVIVENRVNSLGVTEPLVQLVSSNRIVVELPGIEDSDQAISTFRQTGLLEFVDAEGTFLPPGTEIKTSFQENGHFGIDTPTPVPTATSTPLATATVTPTMTSALTPTDSISPTTTVEAEPTPTPTPRVRVFWTVLTGEHLEVAWVGQDEYGRPQINFQLTEEGGEIFAAHIIWLMANESCCS